MAKSRMINTKFWRDDYISNLDPIEKLLFLYFLTNPDTDISGTYEIPLKTIAVDTGIDKEMVLKVIQRFSKDNKIFYEQGWIGIKNFAKHQQDNPKIKVGIQKGLDKAPFELRNKLSIDYTYPIDSLSHLIKSNLIKSNLIKSNLIKSNLIKSNLIKSNLNSNIIKDNLFVSKKFETIDLELSNLLFKLIKENLPTFKQPSSLDSWASDCRLMREQDKRTPEQIKFIIEFCQKDSFWKSNILSMGKLRKQFDQLTAKAKFNSSKNQITII